MSEISSSPRKLPEKVLRRHFELLEEILPDATRLVIEERLAADKLLSHFLRSHRELGARDRRFLSQAVFSYFRWMGWTVHRLGLSMMEAAVTGAALDLDAFSESFRYVASRCSLPPIEPMGGASLDEKLEYLHRLFLAGKENAAPLAPADLVPPEFEELTAPERVDACIEAFQRRPPTWLRVRTDVPAFLETLAEAGIPGETPFERMPEAVRVPPGAALAGKLAAVAARFVIQDIASQCVAKVCAPAEGEDWWDACAGAGGKALHLMDLMRRNGKVLATDVRVAALKELKRRARRHGIRGIRTQVHNVVYDAPFSKTFDGVLVDAPCSGWGTWARNPDARWRTGRRDVIQHANRQLKMLNNAAWCVKPGGTLVYAVCTLTLPETEEVAVRFLDANPAFSLDPFPHPLTGEPTSGQLQIWPWEGPGDAMFIARFRREAPAEPAGD